MVRNYKKKKPAPPYTFEDVGKAVQDVLNKNKTYRQAQEEYHVPISVIHSRIKGRKVPMDRIGARRSCALPQDVEDDIKNCLVARARMGYPSDKAEVLELVGQYVAANNLKTPFANQKPGNDWFLAFLKRNPELSQKKAEHLQKVRKDARNPAVVYDFYQKLDQLIKDLNLDSSDKRAFVFNADETGFCSYPSRLRAIGEKGGSGRESTTVLACISADGCYLPPLIVFKGAAVQARWTSEKSFPGTLYAASKNGWMEEPQFYNWFLTLFVPHVDKLRATTNLPNQGTLLLFDGHCSHISIRIIETALQNNIQLLRFPSHLTDRIQPLDKCVFGPIKTKWDTLLVQYGKEQIGKSSGRLSKQQFAELLNKVWVSGMGPSNIVSGFETTGIYPVDADKFPEELFNPAALKNYRAQLLNQLHRSSSQPDLSPNSSSAQPDLSPSSSSKDLNTIATASLVPAVFSTINVSPGESLAPSPIPELDTPNKLRAVSVLDIFCKQLATSVTSAQCSDNAVKKVIPRLKQMRYGEVLTTNEVLDRLKEAEDRKKPQCKRKTLKAKARNRQNVSNCKKAKSQLYELSDSEDDIVEKLTQDSSDDDTPLSEMFTNENENVEYQTPIWADIKPGVFLLIKFLGGVRKSTTYKYVCTVQTVDAEDGEVVVQGFHTLNDRRREFAITDKDICSVDFEMIEAILPNPEVILQDEKIIYKFSGSVDVFEKP